MECAIAKVLQDGLALRDLPHSFQDNHEVVSAAVQQNALALLYASENLRSNPEIVLSARIRKCRCLSFASPAFLDDPNSMLEAMRKLGRRALSYASARLRSDLGFMRAAVQLDCWALPYGDEAIWVDCMESVSHSDEIWNALHVDSQTTDSTNRRFKYSTVPLRRHRGLMLYALEQGFAHALLYSSDELRSDRETVLDGVKLNARALQFASLELQQDRQVVLAALNHAREVFSLSSVQHFKDDLGVQFTAAVRLHRQHISGMAHENTFVVFAALVLASTSTSSFPHNWYRLREIKSIQGLNHMPTSMTPLMRLAALRHAQACEMLLHWGADPTLERGNQTALSIASEVYLGGGGHSLDQTYDVDPATKELIERSLHWSVESHHLFPPKFRGAVRHLIQDYQLVRRLGREIGLVGLSAEHVVHLIISLLPRRWGFADFDVSLYEPIVDAKLSSSSVTAWY